MIIKVSQAIFFATFLYGCLLGGGIEKSVSSGEGSLPPSNINITAAKVTATQLIINGSNFEGVTSVVMTTNARSFSKTFKVISASFNQLITEAVDNVKIPVNTALNLILSDANGQTSFPIEFSLQNGAVTTGDIADGTITLPKIAPPPISGTETQVFAWDPTTQQYIFAPYGGGVTGTGDVVGPATTVLDNSLARFDGTTGKLIKSSGLSWLADYGLLRLKGAASGVFAYSSDESAWLQMTASEIKWDTGPYTFWLHPPLALNAHWGLTFPDDKPLNNQILVSNSGGLLSWVDIPSGGGDLSGPAGSTTNALAYFSDNTGKLIGYNNGVRLNPATGSLILGENGLNWGAITFDDPYTVFNFRIQQQFDLTANQYWILPPNMPTAGQVLTATNVPPPFVHLGWTTPAASDGRLKKNIKPLKKNFLEEVLALAPVSFEWRKDKIKDRPDGIQRGLIAQEVQKIIPESVYKNGDILTIDNYALFSTLIGAIKEQQKQIEELKKLIRKK